MAFFVYMLRCRGGSLYTGSTSNPEKRMKQHSRGGGSKYVRSRLPFTLVYLEEFKTQSEAMVRENQIKGLTRAGKAGLIGKRHL